MEAISRIHLLPLTPQFQVPNTEQLRPFVKLLLLLSAGWLAFNLLQAALLGLDPDEAYYWIYAKALDWGYFDHPPVIALLIALGKSLVPGEAGVRLLMPLLSVGTFLLLWDLVGRPQKPAAIIRLALLFGAMPLLQVYAFVATPDAPLLFFSALFFWSYRRFLEKPDLYRALLWGAVMAALLYSKYHGVLLIFFTVLSNWRLLRQPYFYLAGFWGALLFLPHLYWQYANDFPSFRYHLSGRDDPYELKHTFNYLLNQLLIFSPLLFPLIVRTLWRRKPADELERAFRWVIFGFWAFFFYTTFKGHVEPQWTVILSLCFIVLLYRESETDAWLAKWVQRMAAVSFGLLVIARIVLAWPDSGLRTPFNRQAWVPELEQVAGDLPVVFQDSYRNPALYEFYTGRRAYTFTDLCYRKNQYDLRYWETDLHNQRVLIAGQSTWEQPAAEIAPLPGATFKLLRVDSLQISQKVTLQPELPAGPWIPGERIEFSIALTNPYSFDIFPAKGDLPLSVKERYGPFDCLEDHANLQLIDPPSVWPANSTISLRAVIRVLDGLPAGTYDFFLCIQTGDLPPAFATRPVKIEIGGQEK
ncbi:ArnT family glycosyltransferase [Flavilitoribacter nigricans]|uniref:Glycosyltransferase RgtA/B/C/D-like domain-containing protein n=1 Tax=Flavilitoribacter nigricans (strain ATCC 23147 / DSM 23189 / NBRC 102662 / NCIMB 1420 / SS-2) TaxID=1122177 RepID=A0A2D0N2R6_FLAN2|nr:glycosyltransferase family 39 protein [Flavilitoribacter nigricans]PHN02676.1 hypothetical protein CRP01_31275 [Flavilitoribacter nigricans DSM 23189 = NBRC 102662]